MPRLSRPLIHPWPLLGAPFIKLAGRFQEPGRPDLVHCLNTMALHVYEYAGTIWLDGRKVELRPGDITITPATEPSWYYNKKPSYHLCFHFEALGRPTTGSVVSLPLHVRPGAYESQTRETVQHIIQLHHAGRDERNDGPAHMAAHAALQAFLLSLPMIHQRNTSAQKSLPATTAAALQKLRRLLDERYREAWSAAQLARAAGLSPAYLARMFRRQFGLTMQMYLLHRRVDCARHLLLTTSDSIKSIAYASGFPNQQYFCRQFQLVTRQTASKFRST